MANAPHSSQISPQFSATAMSVSQPLIVSISSQSHLLNSASLFNQDQRTTSSQMLPQVLTTAMSVSQPPIISISSPQLLPLFSTMACTFLHPKSISQPLIVSISSRLLLLNSHLSFQLARPTPFYTRFERITTSNRFNLFSVSSPQLSPLFSTMANAPHSSRISPQFSTTANAQLYLILYSSVTRKLSVPPPTPQILIPEAQRVHPPRVRVRVLAQIGPGKPVHSTKEERQASPIPYVDEQPLEETHSNYFNRGQTQGTEAPRFRSSFRLSVLETPHRGSAPKPSNTTTTQPASHSYRKHDSNGNTASIAQNTMLNLSISEEEFEQRMFLTKMDLVQKGKVQGLRHSQNPSESDLTYHTRLYHQACQTVKSEIRAADGEKRDVRFQGPGKTTAQQTPPSASSDSSEHPERPQIAQKRPRPSLLLLEPPGDTSSCNTLS
ncbi:hypothetical protein JOM56_013037 [Amanita muscaria]